ncbi:MAG TPA: DUF975 family protein [Clostridiaceae bacterium]
MWTRYELKEKAKLALKNSYLKAFLVSFIIVIVGGNPNYSIPSFNWSFGRNSSGNTTNFYTPDYRILTIIMGFAIISIAIISILTFAIRVFIGYPLEVGGRRYFVKAAENKANLSEVGFAFQKGIYIEVVKAMLWRSLINFLWYLLLIIPGIVKAYAYRMVPYILADNPEIGYDRALKLSMDMTEGEKADIFILDLSFIGWYILGTLALLIGVFFLFPYINATSAELYITLRNNAIEASLTSYEELKIEPMINA